jgi:hypothetical protein
LEVGLLVRKTVGFGYSVALGRQIDQEVGDGRLQTRRFLEFEQ